MKEKILGTLVLIFVILQFFGETRTNPPELNPIQIADEHIVKIFERSCYDCHTNKTNWPWYSAIAPVSWYVVDDVMEGRKELNFSSFEDYSDRRKKRKLEEIKEEIEKGKMPMDEYLITHSDAELSESDKQAIYNWVDQALLTYVEKVDSTESK